MCVCGLYGKFLLSFYGFLVGRKKGGRNRKERYGRERGKPYNDELSGPLGGRRVLRILIREREVPVRGREAAKGADEGEEDEEEDDVGSERADEEDEADESCVCRPFGVSLVLFPFLFACVEMRIACVCVWLGQGGGGHSDAPIKTRKNAKLALNPGVCSPSGFPGFPSWPAICVGSVT